MSALSLQPETFYSSEEVSDFLHLSLRTVQRLLHNHTLPAYKIQGQYRIKGLDLLNYLDQNRQGDAPLEHSNTHLSHLLDVSPISITFGKNWLTYLHWNSDEKENLFLVRLPEFRRHMIETLGFIVPGFKLKDQPVLAPHAYRVFIHDIPIFEGEEKDLDSPEALDLLFKHLEKMIQQHAHELLSRDEVAVILEKIRETRPAVVEEIMHSELNPNGLVLGQLTQVLRYLLKEQVSIRNFGLVLESLADHLPQWAEKGMTLDVSNFGEKLRQSLSRQINVALADQERVIEVMTLDPALEEEMLEALTSAEEKQRYSFFNGFRKVLQASPEPRILLCAVTLRRPLYELLYRQFPEIRVLSYQEIHENYRVREVYRLSKEMMS